MLKQADGLFTDEAEREAFVRALVEGQSRAPAIILLHDHPALRSFSFLPAFPWQPEFVARIDERFKPAQNPLYDQGIYYPLDLSSVFAARPLLEIDKAPNRMLDLCASPGGKTIFAWRALRPEFIVANETIRKRCSTLIANLERCRIEGSAVGSADPSVWARKYPEGFDLILADAPCSGQSLLAKGDEAPGCFHPQMIDMNVGRQRRILGNAAQALRPGGHLLYTTCTFSRKENENVASWLMHQYPALRAVEVPALRAFQSEFASFPCYRLYPQSGLGAGAFSCLITKDGEAPAHWPPLRDLPVFWRYGASNAAD